MSVDLTSAQGISLRQEMLTYDSCLVSDALERLGLPRGITGISRQSTRKRVFGPAVTVTLREHDGSIAKRHLGTSAIDAANPADVVVVEHKSRSDCAGWGGLLCTAARAKGISGIVVEGLARDIDEAEDLDMPVFSRGVTPVTARGRVSEVATNDPVRIGDVEVIPGDYVLADGSGVAIIPRARLLEVVEVARDLIAAENQIRAALAQGIPISQAMDQKYETMLAKT